MTEVSLYELILDRESITDALDDYLSWKEVLDQDLKVVFVIDEGKWFLKEGYKLLIKQILDGKEYFDVVPIGEQREEEQGFTAQEDEYYEDYEGYSDHLKRKYKPEFDIPSSMDRWFPDSTMKHKGLEDFNDDLTGL